MQEVFPKIRREPACLEITAHQDRGDPTRFMLFEIWTNEEEFVEFESGRDYTQDYLAQASCGPKTGISRRGRPSPDPMSAAHAGA